MSDLLNDNSSPVQPGSSFDVLLIEDDDRLRALLASILESQGKTVCHASEGKRAIALFSSCTFKIVITDIYMPEMDGYEVIMKIASIDPSIPILAISGGAYNSAEQSLRPARILGQCRTLAKPFTPAEFIANVRELMAKFPVP